MLGRSHGLIRFLSSPQIYFENYENRKIDYLIITSEEISIDLNHYDYKYRVILKKTFTDLLKQVFNKDTQKWETKRNKQHCFTDEEAETILRTAQTHLSTDIKLSYISINNYPRMMMMLKKQLEDYFYNIADYKYGRYGDSRMQFFMKQDNHNIFVMLM